MRWFNLIANLYLAGLIGSWAVSGDPVDWAALAVFTGLAAYETHRDFR